MQSLGCSKWLPGLCDRYSVLGGCQDVAMLLLECSSCQGYVIARVFWMVVRVMRLLECCRV